MTDAEPDMTWHAGAHAAAEEAFALLLACEQPAEHWRHAGYEQGVAVQSLAYGHHAWAALSGWVDYGYALFRGTEHFPLDEPADVFDTLHDWEARPGWDSTLNSLRVLHPLPLLAGAPPGRFFAVAQHLATPAMANLVGPREFVFVLATWREAVGTTDERFMSACRSEPGATAAVAPTPEPGYTRGDLFLRGVVLRRHPEGGSQVTLLTCAAPRGNIPRAAVNIVGGTRAAALLADLRKHLDARRAAAAIMT